MRIDPTLLVGHTVTLQPLQPQLFDELAEAALSAPEIFRYLPMAMATRQQLAQRFELNARMIAEGSAAFWITRLCASGAVVGSTALLVTDAQHRRFEIGHTWLVPAAQRTGANREAKYLQLRHAFDVLGALRVEFKTDARNAPSRRAIARLGAQEEGTLRAHMICPDGHIRDSVYFSIIASEWPAVRQRLEARSAAR